jgi:dienelactone hydrolase
MIRLLMALLLLSGIARAETVTIPGPDGLALKAQLYRPEGTPIAPAIVALHGCGGPFPARDKQWSELLTGAGHIVLFPDSFGSRGLTSQCNIPENQRVAQPGGLRRRDALAAVAWLAMQPNTPAGGVVVMGWSNGGSTTLATGNAQPDVAKGLIRGLIAFYPGCNEALHLSGWKPIAPLLIMIGDADDWTKAAPCRALAERSGSAIRFVTYAGAYHDFDVPDRPIRTRSSAAGMVHAGTDPAARADALKRVPAFLAGLP